MGVGISKSEYQYQQHSKGYVQIWTKTEDKREERTIIKKKS